MWKSGAEWQQLAGRRSGLKPCEEPKWVIWWEVGGGNVIVKLLRCDIYSVQHRVTIVAIVSNLCEEVMPQNVVQVGPVLWHLGKQAGD